MSEESSSNERQSSDWRFLALFMLLFLLFELAYYTSRDTIVERFLIDHATVSPSVQLINWIAPQESVVASGHRLISPHVKLSVLNGCEGTETILLLISAILAFGIHWRYKIAGIFFGTALVYLFNQGRIVSLYYALRYDKTLFDMIHGYIGPTIMIILAGLFFLAWINLSNRFEAKRTQA